jgi:hypothetical protein
LLLFAVYCTISLLEDELFPSKMISQLSLLPIKDIPIG